jgi:hypothetical protein
MRNEFGEMLLNEPFLTLPSHEGRLLALTLRLGVLRAMVFEATGGAGLQVRAPPAFSSSTITTIQTPI